MAPLLRRKSDCTTVTANPHRFRPALHTPSGPSGHLPRFAEKGRSPSPPVGEGGAKRRMRVSAPEFRQGRSSALSIAAMTLMLASVVDAAEAELALKGGVDVIDFADPGAGALGALPIEAIRQRRRGDRRAATHQRGARRPALRGGGADGAGAGAKEGWRRLDQVRGGRRRARPARARRCGRWRKRSASLACSSPIRRRTSASSARMAANRVQRRIPRRRQDERQAPPRRPRVA